MIDMTNTPFIVLDLDIMKQNCNTMSQNLNAQNIKWRPHIKSHKSVFLAQKQLEWGASAITCATLGEARVMADAGFDDIFIAYPLIGKTKAEGYFALHQKVKTLRTLVNSVEGAKGLSAAFAGTGQSAEVLIEIDGRFGRGGIAVDDILAFAEKISAFDGINIVGLCSYCGAAGQIMDKEARKEDAKKEATTLLEAADILKNAGFSMDVLSSGSSVSARYPECLKGITEVRAGTCTFNDMKHLSLGTAAEEHAAVKIHTTVVTLIAPGKAIVDAGSKTLTSDLSPTPGYGKVLPIDGTIVGLSEEHGFLEYPVDTPLKVGDILQIIPSHVCVVMNLADRIVGVSKNADPIEITIDARGLNR